jgi:hypothetical protein
MMKISVYCVYHNREHEVNIPIDPTCDTKDEVRIVIGTHNLKTSRVEKICLKQWREAVIEDCDG